MIEIQATTTSLWLSLVSIRPDSSIIHYQPVLAILGVITDIPPFVLRRWYEAGQVNRGNPFLELNKPLTRQVQIQRLFSNYCTMIARTYSKTQFILDLIFGFCGRGLLGFFGVDHGGA